MLSHLRRLPIMAKNYLTWCTLNLNSPPTENPETPSDASLLTWGSGTTIILVSAVCFAAGIIYQHFRFSGTGIHPGPLPTGVWLLCAMVFVGTAVAWRGHQRWQTRVSGLLDGFTATIDAIPANQLAFWIAVAAGCSLFTELLIIRLHASFFQLFAYFKNVSLLSCFLGLGIGYARGNLPQRLAMPLVMPLLAVQIALMHALRQLFPMVNTLLQNPIPEQFALGMKDADHASHLLTVYGFLAMIFAANAICFVPLGHLASRLMARQPKLAAYGWNLLGSLGGILAFYTLSFAWAAPWIWLVCFTLLLTLFFYKHPPSLLLCIGAGIPMMVFLNISFLGRYDQRIAFVKDIYSPYQLLTLTVKKSAPPQLQVNNFYYQDILGPENWFAHYKLPYRFKPTPADVLIVGSGTGNDVAAAIDHGAGRIDAVEIDPAILALGKALHPKHPYQHQRVRPVVDDARAFIRRTGRKYDLIVYGLLDSHTRLSSLSSVRLDSFVYTVEAFREARRRLKPGGLISVTFAIEKVQLGRKLYLMLSQAFDGRSPRVYQTGYNYGHTFIIGNTPATTAIADAPGHPIDVTAIFDNPAIETEPATDDWPFLYMLERTYPRSYLIMFVLLFTIAWLLVRQNIPAAGRCFSAPCFFLGAGFMLVETKNITELALVYGSTWVVIAAVISAILIMAFIANLLVMKLGRLPTLPVYGALVGSLLIGLLYTASGLSAHLPAGAGKACMTLLLSLPLFFSGFAFSTELQRSASVSIALSSNLLGAMLGGFLEYNALLLGFRALYGIALAMYGLAFMASLHGRRT